MNIIRKILMPVRIVKKRLDKLTSGNILDNVRFRKPQTAKWDDYIAY